MSIQIVALGNNVASTRLSIVSQNSICCERCCFWEQCCLPSNELCQSTCCKHCCSWEQCCLHSSEIYVSLPNCWKHCGSWEQCCLHSNEIYISLPVGHIAAHGNNAASTQMIFMSVYLLGTLLQLRTMLPSLK
jgi:hypothetical protein